ncbi:hypothetical protein J2751_002401 [Halorubrum alkaliphilum]|uniref:Inner membrane protein YgaP-like transmembrane domain-containing protein n=1 Tax=Halorubrum alkaliphilum TaxID=261290 RepID=A0A8T4GHZ5_9EURY|nr:DUF2892 domain-containing protein [Halorubrum alkaliphilum]MBP1923359.1 hypothetical protein [Halorubrum alkaliphilum]
MDKNVGSTDGRVRTAVGAVAGALSIATLAGVVPLPELAAPLLGVVALAALGTAATGVCGLYSVLGVNTCRVSPDESR